MVLTLIETEESRQVACGVANHWAGRLYEPHPDLGAKVAQLEDLESLTSTQKGRLMEQVAYLVFKGWVGGLRIQSFFTATHQYDLVATGNSLTWRTMCWLLRMPNQSRSVLVECKGSKKKFAVSDFAEMTSIISNDMAHGVGLGIVFCVKGASGFLQRGNERKKSYAQCRLKQLLFYTRTGVPIVVFDKADIQECLNTGGFLKLLLLKINEIVEGTGLAANIERDWREELPEHLTEPLPDV